MENHKTFEIVRQVSRKFFEKYDHANVTCPMCGDSVRVVVSTLTIANCDSCGARLTVEFVEK